MQIDPHRDKKRGEKSRLQGKNKAAIRSEGMWQPVPHRGLEPAACFDIWLAAFHILDMLYETPFPTEPQNDLVPEKAERNAEIRERHCRGETIGELADAFDISIQRVSQVVHGRRS